MLSLKRDQSGDTLVEVLLATVVLSIVLAGAFSLSTRALRINQTATERTEVVNKMREQAEALSYVANNRDSLAAEWQDIKNISSTNRTFYFKLFVDPSDIEGGGFEDPRGGNFIQLFTDEGENGASVDSYGAKGDVDLFDVWIEPRDGTDYIDFVVNGRWLGIGDNKVQSSTSVLRISTAED